MSRLVCSLVVVLATILLASARTAVESLSKDYSFKQYIQDNHVTVTEAEYTMREQLFKAELARVLVHNEASNADWKETLNEFSILTHKEKSQSRGYHKGVGQTHALLGKKRELPNDFTLKPVSELPKSVDWRTTGICSAVKNQGGCGSCWAFASTAVIESHVAKASGLLFDLSVQQITMCAPNPNSCGGTGGCGGATAEIAFDYVSSSAGLLEEEMYGYQNFYGAQPACAIPPGPPKAAIKGYVQLPANNYTALMNAIATVGPVAVSVDASTWGAYHHGIFDNCNQAQPDINHAVVLVGYGEENGKKYWLVRNSWSASWGEAGYIRLARKDAEEQTCGTDVTPQDGTACADDLSPQTVCGTCGILFDSAYPTGAKAL